jgi:hypothetical protein
MPVIQPTSTKADNAVIVTDVIRKLDDALQTLKPDHSQTTQRITYALLATAMVGIFVYHYIKKQEELN